MKIIFATNNLHKLNEIRKAVPDSYEIYSLEEQAIQVEIPETSDTLEGNAIEKAMFIYENYGLNCFADDTGLEVEALAGAPGVYSARYAGPACSFEDNIVKLLSEMNGISNRKARFKTVIAFVENGEIVTFEGIINGQITTDRRGKEGFGYDPVFLPDQGKETFAEMSLEEKNRISHRALAVKKFTEYLSSKDKQTTE
ncbi:MAG: RdgB/HAM1 family non-canonical purine NTP pyrophosphatase [Bacteroidales bacterium]|nr:RdgB/HAM1 family non-canonical purine NTP pyrophosphatase [Bacteroidales bacterium]